MYRIAVIYPNGEGKRFDFDDYLNRHIPLVKARLEPFGMKDAEVDQGLEQDGAPPTYVVIASLVFDALEDFQRGMAAHGAEILGDIPNYTDIRPVFQVSRRIL